MPHLQIGLLLPVLERSMDPLRDCCPAVPRAVLHLELRNLFAEFIDVATFDHQDSVLAYVSYTGYCNTNGYQTAAELTRPEADPESHQRCCWRHDGGTKSARQTRRYTVRTCDGEHLVAQSSATVFICWGSQVGRQAWQRRFGQSDIITVNDRQCRVVYLPHPEYLQRYTTPIAIRTAREKRRCSSTDRFRYSKRSHLS